MTRTIILAVLSLTALSLSTACSRHASLPAAAPEPRAAAAAPATVNDGSPQIVLSPDSVHIDYRVYGAGEPALVLIHGWACDANYWYRQIDALKARYTVVTLNLAGHGASGNNRTDWSLAHYAGDVATVVRQIGTRRVILVGHSMGADVALLAAPLLQPRVIGLIAIEALRSAGLPPVPPREIEMRLKPFRKDFVGEMRRFVASSLFRADADQQLVQKVAYDMSLEPAEVAIPSLQALLSMDVAAALQRAQVPVLAINSDLSPTDAARIAKAAPGFHLDVLEHSGHFLMLEDPARFNPLLLRDLETLAHGSR